MIVLIQRFPVMITNSDCSSELDQGCQKKTVRNPEISYGCASMISFDSHMTLTAVRDIVCEIEKQVSFNQH